jgi:hypothetical protein
MNKGEGCIKSRAARQNTRGTHNPLPSSLFHANMLKVAVVVLYGVVTAIATQIDLLTAQALTNIESKFATNRHPDAETCTLENATVRREWSVSKKLHE